MRYLLILFLFCVVVHAEDWENVILNGKPALHNIKTGKFEDAQDIMKLIEKDAGDFIDHFSTYEKEKIWHKKFQTWVDTRATDLGLNDNDAADEIVIEFLTPRRNQKQWDDFEALELCRMFLFYLEKRWELPERVRRFIKDDEGKALREIININIKS